MNIQEIVKRNYDANVKRGKISNRTSFSDFWFKAIEEMNELAVSNAKQGYTGVFDPLEAIDVILVNCSLLHHFGYDVAKLLEEKTIINENRKD